MKKLLLIFSVIIFIMLTSFYNASAEESNISVAAEGAILMDANTGEILYSKNIDTQYAPASTTKLMTALLTLENCKLDDIITVGKNPPFAIGSSIGLIEGEVVTVKDVLYGLLLPSGNDCALALAEQISGSEENFVKMMNKRALELGCKNTNFVNSCGLYDKDHRTTPMDLALIMKELIKHSEFSTIALTPYYKMKATNKTTVERFLQGENALALKPNLDPKHRKYYYEGIEGGKTGYTVESFASYVASASRDGHRFIVVLLHDETNNRFFPDAVALLNYGFDNFNLTKLYSKGDFVTNYKTKALTIPLYAEDDFYYTENKNEALKPEFTLEDTSKQIISIKKGDYVSKGDLTLGTKTLGSLNLVSGNDYMKKTITLKSSDSFSHKIMTGLYIFVIIIISILILILILRFIIKIFKRKKKKVYYY
ncbi:MAG TPA: D-alanyl-D-alanine carboxypeptidase family protein [Clostridiaceae bacterium]